MLFQHSGDVMFLMQLKSSAEEVVFGGHGVDFQGTASMFHPFMFPIELEWICITVQMESSLEK